MPCANSLFNNGWLPTSSRKDFIWIGKFPYDHRWPILTNSDRLWPTLSHENHLNIPFQGNGDNGSIHAGILPKIMVRGVSLQIPGTNGPNKICEKAILYNWSHSGHCIHRKRLWSLTFLKCKNSKILHIFYNRKKYFSLVVMQSHVVCLQHQHCDRWDSFKLWEWFELIVEVALGNCLDQETLKYIFLRIF